MRLKQRFKRIWVLLTLLIAVAIVCLSPKIVAQLPPTSFLSSPRNIIPASLFGMHVHKPLRTWPNVPFSVWRLWDAGVVWGNLEPQKGSWNFQLLDRYVNLADQKNVEILLTLGQTPRWASARPNDESPYGNPGWPAEPANIQDWRNYVRTVATRYKGKIRYYEIWNEPDYRSMYTGSVSKMVELAREAYTILKQVDPDITVLSPPGSDGTPDLEWQKSFFRGGGGRYADVIAQHFYPQTVTAIPEDLANYIRQFKAVMSTYNLTNKPLWNTEMGWAKSSVSESSRLASAYIARSYLINWAGGVRRLYWYSWDHENVLTLRLIGDDLRTPTPAAQGYSQIYRWMVGAQMQECGVNSNQIWICQMVRNGQPFWIIWNPVSSLTFEVPRNWNVRNIQRLSGRREFLPASRAITVDYSPVLLASTPPQ